MAIVSGANTSLVLDNVNQRDVASYMNSPIVQIVWIRWRALLVLVTGVSGGKCSNR